MPEPQGRRFNHFAMPSETHLRTLLLAGTIFAVCWSIGFYFNTVLWVPWTGATPVLDIAHPDYDVWHTVDPAQPGPSAEGLTSWFGRLQGSAARMGEPAERLRVLRELDRLRESSRTELRQLLPHFLVPLFFAGASVLAIALVYLTHGYRIRRRLTAAEETSPLTSEIRSEARTLISDAERIEGARFSRPLSRLKAFVTRSHLPEGLTYGLPGWYTVVLSSSLGLVLRRDLKEHGRAYRFRALLLHELGHIVNLDIGRAYWARASWLIFVPLAVAEIVTLPFLHLTPRGSETPATEIPWILFVQTSLAILVLETMRRGLLRNREHYADLRAAFSMNSYGPLREILGSDRTATEAALNQRRSAARLLGSIVGRVKGLWSLHPTREQRAAILDDPTPLSKVSSELSLQAGLLFGFLIVLVILNSSLLTLVLTALIQERVAQATQSLITMGSPNAIFFHYSAGASIVVLAQVLALLGLLLAASYFLVAAVGAQIQKETLAQEAGFGASGSRYLPLLRPAFLTALGIELGHDLVPNVVLISGPPAGLLSSVLWVLPATLSLWLWMASARLLAQRFLATHIGRRPPTFERRLLLPVMMLLLWLALLPALALRVSFWQGMSKMTGGVVLYVAAVSLLGFGAIVALSTFLSGFVRLRRELKGRFRCPSCEAPIAEFSVRASCSRCGEKLAPWLFTPGEPLRRVEP